MHWTDEEQIRDIFSGVDLVGHNVAYDCAVIGAQYPEMLPAIFETYEEEAVTDTMLRQRLIDIATDKLNRISFVKNDDGKPSYYGLANLAKRHLDVDMDKDTWRKRYGEFRDLPLDAWPEGARDYALGDAATTFAVWQTQEKDNYWLKDQHRQARAAFCLYLMSCWGLTTDRAAVRAFADGVRAERERLAKVLVDAGLKRPPRELKSGARKGQVVEGTRDANRARLFVVAAYHAKGLQHPTTAKGAPALDEDACLKSCDPVLKAWAEFASAEHKLSTDVPLLERPIIQARFTTPLETGRTSTSPNIQNLPQGEKDERGNVIPNVRECFTPRPGYVYAAVDFSGLELHTWAQACIVLLGRSRMAEVLNSGNDAGPHDMMAATILRCSLEEAYKRAKDKEPVAVRARQCGKVCNFGYPGGLGAARFVHYAALQYKTIVTEDEAKALKRQWLTTWPEAQPYLDYIARLTERPDARVEQIFSGRFRGGLSYCDAANGFFQGLGADAAKAALWPIAKACYVERDSVLFGSRPVNFVHDEVIVEVPEETAHECLLEIERLMIEGATPWLPDVLPRVEGTLMRRWSKHAKRIVQDGRVIAWEAPTPNASSTTA